MPRASDRHVLIAWKKVVALGKKWLWLEKNGYYVMHSAEQAFSLPPPTADEEAEDHAFD
jgi:hypothetical protein